MGDYLTYEDVWEMLINFNIGPTPRVGNDQVEEHITGYENDVNAILRSPVHDYPTIPVTNAEAITIIREHIRQKVAALVYVELQQPTRSPDFIRTWDLDYADWIKMLRDGKIKLPGGESTLAGDAIMSGFNLRLTEVDTDA
jgi:hypothetical protein